MSAQQKVIPSTASELAPGVLVNENLKSALGDVFQTVSDLSGLPIDDALAACGEHLVILDLTVQGALPLLEAISRQMPDTKVLVISDALSCLLYTSDAADE